MSEPLIITSETTGTDWELVIGLEVHAELATVTKMFSGAPNVFGGEPNTNVTPVDLGLPGTLPVVNEKVIVSPHVRPHDIDIFLEPTDGAEESLIDRVTYLGFEVRVELTRHDGTRVWAQIPRDEAERLEVGQGQIVYARARLEKVFAETQAVSS